MVNTRKENTVDSKPQAEGGKWLVKPFVRTLVPILTNIRK